MLPREAQFSDAPILWWNNPDAILFTHDQLLCRSANALCYSCLTNAQRAFNRSPVHWSMNLQKTKRFSFTIIEQNGFLSKPPPGKPLFKLLKLLTLYKSIGCLKTATAEYYQPLAILMTKVPARTPSKPLLSCNLLTSLRFHRSFRSQRVPALR